MDKFDNVFKMTNHYKKYLQESKEKESSENASVTSENANVNTEHTKNTNTGLFHLSDKSNIEDKSPRAVTKFEIIGYYLDKHGFFDLEIKDIDNQKILTGKQKTQYGEVEIRVNKDGNILGSENHGYEIKSPKNPLLKLPSNTTKTQPKETDFIKISVNKDELQDKLFKYIIAATNTTRPKEVTKYNKI